MKDHVTAIGEILFDMYGTKKVIGGAPFNFIYHIHKFGINSNFITGIGEDQDGSDIIEFLDEHNFPRNFIKIVYGKQTGKVLVKLSKEKVPEYQIKQNVAYDYIELTNEEREQALNKTQMMYFGTLSQRESVSRNTIHSLLQNNQLNFCDLNLRQSFYSKEIIDSSLKLTKILKLSSDELNIVNNVCFNKTFDINDGVKNLQTNYNIDYIAVTLGENGARLFSKDDSVISKPFDVDVVDTLGAGDAYSAFLAIGILKNMHIEEINRLAVSFAGDICRVKGALPQSQELYDNYLEIIANE